MALPTVKELKKLAAGCRKAGIKSLKCEGFEFTLTDYTPEPKLKAAAQTAQVGDVRSVIDQDFETEALTQDQLLGWSCDPTEEQPEA